MAEHHFTSEFFSFLRDLAANNDRSWFDRNKQRYNKHVKEPLIQFVVDFAPHLVKISPHFLADPRPVGGSMFRIYRDTRFSKDKRPYKTNAGLHFRHERGKDVHAPGFYLHLAPDSVFAGSGIWKPDSKSLASIRKAIDEQQEAWTAAVTDKEFKSTWNLGGESLKRPPKGYAADHPLINDLKRKDFIASTELSEAEALSNGFVEKVYEAFRSQAPVVRFLAEALELAY